ncbi:hypothetical protein P152DRAFT_400389 [Eremomyces bilateralis CBS 781.70]|uniref:Phosphatidate phosphatase APP1 catalytic domain-containing protein n=1 Tax=Eremomyces bilateralis CBS 781.70 TaxID=1392243 RepID=A0A6G1FYA6_9PEZI|nr:uncharacterized protein P152DRAFT_400389 [Eremomyces bilateralis CBS 781.70]KAF1810748.1 hypothetical protein P152DRAFT_400389 [Eremomyces bilateralis CBS 781.70]
MALSKAALSLVIAQLYGGVSGSPAPLPNAAPHPMITPSPALHDPSRTFRARGIVSDVTEGFGGFTSGVDSVFRSLGSAIPSYVASGVPNFFQDFPVGDKVQSSLGIDDEQVRALPTQVLNVPPYANWSNGAWNIRFRGNVYKQPNTSEGKLNELANIFLIDTDVQDLPPEQQAQARNVTASIFILQQDDENVTMHMEPADSAGSSGEPGGGGAVTPEGGVQNATLPDPTTELGDFDAFVPIELNGLTAGDEATEIQRLNVYAEGATLGNATAYLVPPTGLTIISDIDDVLRVTKIYKPDEGILNSFARPFTPWLNMPDIYANWSRSIPDTHFHYLTTTPEQATRIYMDFIYKTYPGGSFDTRPLNFSDVSATLSIRQHLLDRIFQTFPDRKFVLVGDTSNSDMMKSYPGLVAAYPRQVQCILMRNTTATDEDMLFPYNTDGFKDLDQQMYMFFNTPDDLTGLDIAGGNCYNASVPQHLTFGYQAERLGVHGDTGAAGRVGVSWYAVVGLASFIGAFLAL